MKKIIQHFIMLSMVLLLIGNYSLEPVDGRQIDDSAPECLSFTSTGAIFLESRLDAWATIDSTLLSSMSFDKVCNILGIQKYLTLASGDKTYRDESLASGKERYEIIQKEINPNKILLVVSITTLDSSRPLGRYAQELSGNPKIQWHFNYTYTGEIEAPMNPEAMRNCQELVLKKLQGYKLREFNQGATVSLQGWSPMLPFRLDNITEGGNMQIGLRHEEKTGTTRIWVGIPLIMNDY